MKKAWLIIWHIATANEAALTVKMSLLYSSAGIGQMNCSRNIFSTNFNTMYISQFRSRRFSELELKVMIGLVLAIKKLREEIQELKKRRKGNLWNISCLFLFIEFFKCLLLFLRPLMDHASQYSVQ